MDNNGRKKWFWIPWGIDAFLTSVLVYFFLAGLIDGSVSSFNADLWILILLSAFGVTIGTLLVKKSGRPGLGAFLAWIVAIPGLLVVLFLLLILILHPRWN